MQTITMENLLFKNEELSVGNSSHYLVLARKYRPTTFADMVGQDVLIKTFTNAVSVGRIAHAFLLTGIRGVGKTTTARIIARALNCTGLDGKGEITISPCGKCNHCEAIAEDRHQDVIEIDAASHTGVNDIRDIIENARYRPIYGRFKIYIIDEVHMLSNSAFNALLKTLEEPPMHVKFIFATTEIKKIPLTILSRCQRFDLKRVSIETLTNHFKSVLQKEGLEASDDSLKMIASSSNGSVRDGLSILDQAISHTGGNIVEPAVREMLGLSSTDTLYQLYEHILKNEMAESLQIIDKLYSYGADPVLVLQDLMNITHTMAKAKVNMKMLEPLPEFDKTRITAFLKIADISRINRIWLALIKGFEEIKGSYNPIASLEMILIRVSHLSNLPAPEDLIKKLKARNTDGPSKDKANEKLDEQVSSNEQMSSNQNSSQSFSQNSSQSNKPKFTCMEDIEKFLFEHEEMDMCHHLRSDVRLVSLEPNRIALKLLDGAPKAFNNNLKDVLERITGEAWAVLASLEEGEQTLAQKHRMKQEQKISSVLEDDTVNHMLKAFTGLEIADIKLETNA